MTTNSLTAINPELWSTMVQIPLYKTLVALEVATVHEIPNADTIHTPRFSDVSAKDYTPLVAGGISAYSQTWAYDTINITTYKHATVYIDEASKTVVNVDMWQALAAEEAYQIKNKIDKHVFNNITGSTGGTTGFFMEGVDTVTLCGTGTANHPVSAVSGNIIPLFAGARKILRQQNVEEMGDWCAVISPVVAHAVEIKAANTGFNVADATLRNGYAGSFMGFEVYISNNLPSGRCSAVSYGTSATFTAARNCRSQFFGRKKMIDLYLKSPQLRIAPRSDSIGSNYTTWTVYGSGVGTKNRSRGLNVACDITYSGGVGG